MESQGEIYAFLSPDKAIVFNLFHQFDQEQLPGFTSKYILVNLDNI
jgi:hypothetical protein